jgi:hypothetical protein
MIFDVKKRYQGTLTSVKFLDKEVKGETREFIHAEIDLSGAEAQKMELPNVPAMQRPCKLSYKKDMLPGLMEFVGPDDDTQIAVKVNWWVAGLIWDVEPSACVAVMKILCRRTPEAIRFFGERFGGPVTFRMGEQQGDLMEDKGDENGLNAFGEHIAPGRGSSAVKRFVDGVGKMAGVESLTVISPGHAPVKIPGGAVNGFEKRGRGRPKKNPE